MITFILPGVCLILLCVLLLLISDNSKEIKNLKEDNINSRDCLLNRLNKSEDCYRLLGLKAIEIVEMNIKLKDRVEKFETKLDLIAQHLKVKFELEPAKEAKLILKK